ncbi:hypothetical protein [Aliarcobacter butzleri]|uniref:hypothetical protein n=1 Tax=Aliarcobacter butzleri TaxID=28197 RepID=UPI0021B18ABB|nr:hypothetical protein [Aliarcobacter butzleri]UWY60110.1 hypothetical protein N3115_10270 [Aliarcobacter butzleri]
MLLGTYGMIVPEKDSCKNYELFYNFYSLNIKQNLLIHHLLNEVKYQLPVMSLEVKESINHKINEINNIFPVMGIKKETTRREKYRISILSDDLSFRETFFDGDYESYINYITNFQQIISLYSSFESTIKNYLIEQGEDSNKRFFQKNLLKDVCNINHNFIKIFHELYKEFTENDFNVIWKYFTIIRNLYSHSSGIIDENFIKEIKSIKNELSNTLNNNFNYIERSFTLGDEEILQTDNLKINNLFIIRDIELNFFRNFIIYIWEAIYLSHFNLTEKKPYETRIKFKLTKNSFKFNLVKTSEENVALNQMSTFYTKRMYNFYVSTYVCPNCSKEPVILYKTLFHPNISLYEITTQEEHKNLYMERIFTCPSCKSFYFSEYKEKLSDNNGNNILKLNEDNYIFLLAKLNNKGTAYIPGSEENVETELYLETQINQMEVRLNELKNIRKCY